MKFKSDVIIDGHALAKFFKLDLAANHTALTGEASWNPIDGTFDIGLLNGVTLQAGQEIHFYGKATEAISNGDAVQFAGVQGNHLLIKKAVALEINANPEYFMGVATQNFSNKQFGYVTAFGNVRGLNTTSYNLGEILYFNSASLSVPGLLTSTKPTAPNAKIEVAAVVRVHGTQGILMVRPHVMPKVSDIQDVDINTATLTQNSGIFWNQLNSRFENKSIVDALGYTPANASGTTNYVAKFTSGTTIGNSQIFDNGTNVGIGTTSPSYKLDVNGSFRSIGNGYINGILRNIYEGDPLTGTIVSKSLAYNSSPYGLITRIYGSGIVSLQSQRESNDSETFGLTLQPLGGNVGIGTTSPTYKLDVNGVGNFQGVQIGVNGTTINSNLSLLTFDVNSSERMRITSSGNVGIGTTSPTYKLDVTGTFRATTGATIATSIISAEVFNLQSGNSHSQSNIYSRHNFNNDTLAFTAIESTSYNNGKNCVLAVQSDGNNTIGTTDPQQILTSGLVQEESAPADSVNPVKWIKVFDINSGQHYFINLYQ